MDKILTRQELAEYLGVSFPTLYRWEKNQINMPSRIKMGPHRVGWRLSEIDDWLNARPRGTDG